MAARGRPGIALGVLGIMLLAFVSIVFMLGHHTTPDIFLHLDDHPLFHRRHSVEHKSLPALGTSHFQAGIDQGGNLTELDKALEANKAAREKEVNSSGSVATTAVPNAGAAVSTVAASRSPVPDTKAVGINTSPSLASTTKASGSAVVVTPVTLPAATNTAAQKANPDEGLSELDMKYKPSIEMVQKYSQQGHLIVTWANFHYYDFVVTWVKHVRQVGVTGYVVGAMDDKLLEHLIRDDIHCFSMRSGLTLGDFGWGSKTFAKMGREKIRLISVFLKLGTSVVIADVDVIFLRDPIPYFQRYPEADILTSSDHLSNTVVDESLEKWPQAASAANIGIMLFRNKSLGFVEDWIQVIEADDKVWDQNAFNDLFRRGASYEMNQSTHLFMGYQKKLQFGILPVSLFASGHTFFTQRMYKKLKLEPYAVHATFQFSGTAGKRHRLREAMLWEDPPEYYDPPGGVLSFAFDFPPGLVERSGPRTNTLALANVVGHFELVNFEMLRVRNALAIATVLGRTVVVPQMWCGLDRWWAPHAGQIPGSALDLPYPCPLDHVFDLEGGWTRPLGADAFGPDTPFREYSFFNNTKLPPMVRESKVVVEVCPAKTPDCSDGSSPAAIQNGRVRIQPGLLSEKLKVALDAVKTFKNVEFSTMKDAFGNFTSPNDWTKFASRMKIYASIWCCVQAHPGHVHYDMLHDVPHQDKFNAQWNGTWVTKCGP